VKGAEDNALTVYGTAMYSFRTIINPILLSQIPILKYLFLIYFAFGIYTITVTIH